MKLIIDIPEEDYEYIKDSNDMNFNAIKNGIPFKELDENPCLTCGNNCCNHKECEYHNLIILKENKRRNNYDKFREKTVKNSNIPTE